MTMPTLFIPHGGGPCFFMDPAGGPPEPMWRPMQAYLAGLIATLPERPRAILFVSGHWEEPVATVHVGDGQPLLYDYYGFPEHTYRLHWDAPGAPDLARRAAALLGAAGMATAEEAGRGWDHGVFVPMKVMAPGADIPLAQLSLVGDLDPARHIAIGRALAPLRDEGVLIVGSGMSFHNLRAYGDPRVRQPAAEFDHWLVHAAEAPAAERAKLLSDWQAAPWARICHPREEHLMPLMVAAGASEERGSHDFGEEVLSGAVSGFRFT
jgi:aromatic ring-opening dioxygenase catalytic subunit (LigB family)